MQRWTKRTLPPILLVALSVLLPGCGQSGLRCQPTLGCRRMSCEIGGCREVAYPPRTCAPVGPYEVERKSCVSLPKPCDEGGWTELDEIFLDSGPPSGFLIEVDHDTSEHLLCALDVAPLGSARKGYTLVHDAEVISDLYAGFGEIQIVVTGPPGEEPDLVVVHLAAPATATPGATIAVEATVSNVGQGSAASSVLSFFLSADTTLDSGDAPLGNRIVPALGPGESSAGASAFTIPEATPSGPHFVIARADDAGAVPESDETNNTLTYAISISEGGSPQVSIVATDAAASEAGPNSGTFAISRTGPTAAALPLAYTVSGTATNGSDYQSIGSVTIPAGAPSVTVTVTPVDDTVAEGAETVVLTLLAADYTVGVPGSATVVIDDDETVVSVGATDPSAREPELLTPDDTGTFTIRRQGATATPLIVGFTLAGPATNSTDYNALAAVVTIPAGQASVTVTVAPRADALVEGDETVVLTLNPDPAYGLGTPNTATVTIADNAAMLTVEATDAAAAEPETGMPADPGRFTITRANNLSVNLLARFKLAGSATNSTDYNALAAVVTIPAGQASVTVTVAPRADALVEGDETVVLTLNPDPAYGLGTPNTATVTIADNAAMLTVEATDAAAAEPETGMPADPGRFTITRANNLSVNLLARFKLAGSATNSTDYNALATVVTIPAGQASVTVTVAPRADALVEGDESVVLTLNPDPAYVVGAANTATVTIADNAAMLTVEATDAAAAEPETGVPADPGRFTITRANNLSVNLLARFTLAGSATNSTDYNALAAVVTIPAGQASVTVTVTARADAVVEGDETVVLTLNPDPAYEIGAANTATATIADNAAVLTVEATDPAAAEPVAGAPADAGQFTITRANNLSVNLLARFTLTGSAVNGTDYNALALVVTIPAGQASATITVTPRADVLVEGDETVVLTLTPDPAYVVGTAAAAVVTIRDGGP